MNGRRSTPLLEGVTILDLAGHAGQMAGRMLADLGATVIKVEPPEGDPLRRAPHDPATYRHLNAGKKSVVLAPGEDGRTMLEALVADVDAMITTGGAEELDELGLSADRVRSVNSSLVHVSITPFGLTGPRSSWSGPDEVIVAASGILGIAGEAGERPCRPPETQAYYVASYVAVMALLAGVFGAANDVVVADVSMQECLALQEHLLPAWLNDNLDVARTGSQHRSVAPATIFPTRDGHVFLFVSRVHWQAFLDAWPGHPTMFDGAEWQDNGYRRSRLGEVNTAVSSFTSAMTTQEVVDLMQRSAVPCAAVQLPAEYLATPFAARRHLMGTSDDGGGTAPVHLAPFVIDGDRPARLTVSAIGADTDSVVGAEARRSASTVHAVSRSTLPLTGVRVVSLTTGIAGPLSAQYLALLGADVIKVESRHGGIDSFRYFGNSQDLDGSPRFVEMNAGVRSLTLNLKSDQGRVLAHELVGTSDVVLDNFRPKVADRLGLGVDMIRQVKPDAVIVKMPGFEVDGPFSDFSTWGPILSAYTGLSALWNHPDAPRPIGFQGSYPDYVAAAMGPSLVIAGLLHRRRTGRGSVIELSQCEAVSYSLGVAMATAASGGDVRPQGNGCVLHAPCGVYRCQGEDRWCVISVADDKGWLAVREVLNLGRNVTDDRSRAVPESIEDATMAWDADRLAGVLQARGVAASALARGSTLARDPQLAHRAFVTWIDHPVLGQFALPRIPVKFHDGYVHAPSSPPRLGESSREILCDLLGYPHDRFDAWVAQGIVS